MYTKSEIIATMRHAVQLVEDLTNGVGNEITDDLSAQADQLEEEWAGQFDEEA